MLSFLTTPLNEALKGYTPVQVVLGTIAPIVGYNLLQRDWRNDFEWWQNKAFNLLPKVPFIGAKFKAKLDKEFEPELDKMDKDIHAKRQLVYDALPKQGIDGENLLAQIAKDCNAEHLGDQMSGAIYRDDINLDQFNAKIFALSSYTNPLHGGAWPNIAQREAEVIAWCSKLYQGDETICGTITSGGTGSIMEAMRTYKEWAYKEKGITKPNIVIPSSAHAAFEKAAQTYGIRVTKVPVDPTTGAADVQAMKRKINRNTIALIGSAPSYPTGTVDPIKALSEIALANNIGMHVDACLGGFLIPFAEKAGFPLPDFDFRLPGVTTISCDTHKYGQTPKGSSVIMMRKEIGIHQPYVLLDSEIGMYVTPDQPGSRCGANIMMTWGTLALIGEDKYVETTKQIITLRQEIEARLREIEDLEIMGNPQLSLVAFNTKNINIFQVSHMMKEMKGWHLNNIQKPNGCHLCLTARHLSSPDFANRFVDDLKACIDYVKTHPDEKLAGDGAVYATMAKIPGAVSKPVKENLGRQFTFLNSRIKPTRCATQTVSQKQTVQINEDNRNRESSSNKVQLK